MAAPPVPLSSFVGRTAELDLGRELLGRSRLVTITGPGGAGKTRLALELVRDGALAFCDLAPAADADATQAAVASALGLEAEVGGAGRERIARRLQPETGVLVFDNCEQVIDAAAELAETVLLAAPGVRVLATSQEALALPGENLLRLGALSEPDARRLFVERLREGDPRFQADPAAEQVIGEICARLDAIPLALELAAARARTMPLPELLAGLEDRFAILRTASRRAPTRQQTLEAAVAWSYSFLSADESAVFDRVAVLPGAFTAAAAAAVTRGAVEPRDVSLLLSRLGDRSLLELAGDRHRMVETLRAFGRERLRDTGALSETLVRAAHHFDETGAYNTGLAVTQAALAATGADDPRRADLLEVASRQAERAARYDVGMAVLAEMREREDVQAQPERLAFVEMRLGSAASMATGDITQSLPPAEHALAIFRELGDTAMALQAEIEVAWHEGLAGRVEQQLARASAVVEKAAQQVPGSEAHLHALGCAAVAAVFSGRFAAGRDLLDQGLAIARRRQDTYQVGWFIGIKSQLISFTEGPRPALRLLAETRPLLTENPDPVFTEGEAHARILAGSPAALLEADEESLFISFGIRGGFSMSARAAAAAMLGQAARASRLFASAHRLFADSDIYYQGRAHQWFEGLGEWALGSPDAAAEQLLKAGHSVAQRARAMAVFPFRDAADAAWDAGDAALESEALERLGELVREMDSPLFHALTQLGTPAGTEALGRLGCLGLRARSLEREGRFQEAADAYEELGLRSREDRALARLAAAGGTAASPLAVRLSHLVVLQGVPAAELEELAAEAHRLQYEPGETIFSAGSAADAVYAIESGTVRLGPAAEAGPGDLIGERSLLGHESHVATAVAVQATEVLRFHPAALLATVSHRPALAERLVGLVHQRVRQESRQADEPEPLDVEGLVLAGLGDAVAAAGEPLPAFEVLPVYLGSQGPMLLKPPDALSWIVDAAPGKLPAAVIAGALERAGLTAEIVHSTSWRFDSARLVLTYLAIMAGAQEVAGFETVPVHRAELARGTAKGAPASINVGQVVEHGLRHLSWLSRDDPVIREELSPEWLAVVSEYRPEPFRAL